MLDTNSLLEDVKRADLFCLDTVTHDGDNLCQYTIDLVFECQSAIVCRCSFSLFVSQIRPPERNGYDTVHGENKTQLFETKVFISFSHIPVFPRFSNPRGKTLNPKPYCQ